MKHHHHDLGRSRVHDHHHHHDHGGLAERHGRRHRRGGFDRSDGRGRPGFGGHFEGHHRGRRAGRGDVRAAVLALLSEQPMHGYQIIQELAGRSGGAWTPSPGSIYPALQLLQDEGLVTAAETDGKRVFELTDTGRTEAASRGDGPPPWEVAARGESSATGQLRTAIKQVAVAAQQIAAVASEAQSERAVQILAATRRDLYRILAEDEPAEPGEPTA